MTASIQPPHGRDGSGAAAGGACPAEQQSGLTEQREQQSAREPAALHQRSGEPHHRPEHEKAEVGGDPSDGGALQGLGEHRRTVAHDAPSIPENRSVSLISPGSPLTNS